MVPWYSITLNFN